MKPGEQRLRQTIARLTSRPPRPPLTPNPTSGFEVSITERLKALTKEVDQLRGRLNWLLTVIIGAALINILLAFTR